MVSTNWVRIGSPPLSTGTRLTIRPTASGSRRSSCTRARTTSALFKTSASTIRKTWPIASMSSSASAEGSNGGRSINTISNCSRQVLSAALNTSMRLMPLSVERPYGTTLSCRPKWCCGVMAFCAVVLPIIRSVRPMASEFSAEARVSESASMTRVREPSSTRVRATSSTVEVVPPPTFTEEKL